MTWLRKGFFDWLIDWLIIICLMSNSRIFQYSKITHAARWLWLINRERSLLGFTSKYIYSWYVLVIYWLISCTSFPLPQLYKFMMLMKDDFTRMFCMCPAIFTILKCGIMRQLILILRLIMYLENSRMHVVLNCLNWTFQKANLIPSLYCLL